MIVKYKIEILQYTVNTRIIANCNAITFINISAATNVKVNNHTIVPGDSLSIEGNNFEEDITEYYLNFDTAINGIIEVIRKVNEY